MSKVAIQGNASGIGTFTIQSPATNTDRVLTLPDEAGTVLTSVSNIESQVKTATNATGTAPIYACRAWVNFDGTDTSSIRGSGNVSSVTDNGIGDYTVNFTTAMPDANYSISGSGGNGAGGKILFTSSAWQQAPTTSAFRININNTAVVDVDREYIYVAVFR